MEIDLESLPNVSKSKMIVITQPGIRYAQANALVERMLMDSKFNTLSIQERNRILLRLLNEIKGRMLEEIVLLETKIANPSKKVFKLQFSIGEFDMVVFDPKELNCKIYEIKYNHNVDQNQIRHLINKEKCEMTSHRYGQIIEKSVLYRGEEKMVNGIHYQNVEEYLKSLYD